MNIYTSASTESMIRARAEREGKSLAAVVEAAIIAYCMPAPPAPPKRRRQLRLDTRTPSEVVADEAITLMRPAIEPKLTGMNWGAWKQRNRKIAVGMAVGGMTAEAIREAQERTGALMLWHVQERLNEPARAKKNGSALHFALEDPEEIARFEADARAKQKLKPPRPMTQEFRDALSSIGCTLGGNAASPKNDQES